MESLSSKMEMSLDEIILQEQKKKGILRTNNNEIEEMQDEEEVLEESPVISMRSTKFLPQQATFFPRRVPGLSQHQWIQYRNVRRRYNCRNPAGYVQKRFPGIPLIKLKRGFKQGIMGNSNYTVKVWNDNNRSNFPLMKRYSRNSYPLTAAFLKQFNKQNTNIPRRGPGSTGSRGSQYSVGSRMSNRSYTSFHSKKSNQSRRSYSSDKSSNGKAPQRFKCFLNRKIQQHIQHMQENQALRLKNSARENLIDEPAECKPRARGTWCTLHYRFKKNTSRNEKIMNLNSFLDKVVSDKGNSMQTPFQRVIKRNLNVHEYISYKILKEHGLPVPKHDVAAKKGQVAKMVRDLNISDIVLKAQVLTGGRGKGTWKNGMKGGVKLVYSPEEAEQIASKMIGETLVTKQTGEKGIKCSNVMVAERKYSRREFYLCIMMERAYGGPVLMVSAEGGVEIEQVAAVNPEAIHYFPIDIEKGLKPETPTKVTEIFGLSKKKDEMSKLISNLYKLFITKDALMVEVNPLIEDPNGELCCLDAKLRFDDSSKFRQKELFAYRDTTQEDPKEVAAGNFDLNYVALDGNIGCMVNGAGLAMATCDIIQLHGGSPANFLDVGGGSQADQIKEGFKIIMSHEKVQGILVNIFGGIMRCDIIANGIVSALKEIKLAVPVVIRLQGTNVDKGRQILVDSKLKVIPVDDLDEAAKVIVKLATIINLTKQSNMSVKFEF